MKWLAGEDPRLWREYRSLISTRKYWLFAFQCIRRLWDRLAEWPVAHRLTERAEQYAEGTATETEVMAEYQEFWTEHQQAARRFGRSNPLEPLLYLFPNQDSGFAAIPKLARRAVPKKQRRAEFSAQATCLREIRGHPFRPITFDSAWRTDTATAIAAQMYASRDFSAMPILADALQDAGCDSDDILNHCRDPQQVHVRGCWVVDLVLGKS